MEGKRVVVLGSHFHPWAVVFVHRQSFVFVGGHSLWQVSSFVGGGSCPGCPDLCVRVIIIHVVVCHCGCCSWGWVVLCGHLVGVCGWWGSFVGGIHPSQVGG